MPYMKLPLPVIGNLYAPSSLGTFYPNANTNWFYKYHNQLDSAGLMPGSMVWSPTMNQRGTPPVFWASLWNRCLALIDDHNHDPNEDHGGNVLKWGGWTVWLARAQWEANSTSGLNAEVQAPSIQISGNLDMAKRAYDNIAEDHAPGWAWTGIQHSGLASWANPVDDVMTIYYDTDKFGKELRFPSDMTDPGLLTRGSLYIRMKFGRDKTDVTGTSGTQDGLGGEGVQSNYGFSAVTNFNPFPSLSLEWNAGEDSGLSTTIVSNEPPGAHLGAWKFYAYDPQLEGGMPFSNSGENTEFTFQDPLTYTSPPPASTTTIIGGYYKENTNRPYVGILDGGNDEFDDYSGGGRGIRFRSLELDGAAGGLGSNSYPFYGQTWNGRSHILWDNTTYTNVASMIFSDIAGVQDPRLEIPRPISKDMKGEVFFSPYWNGMSWFMSALGDPNEGYGPTYAQGSMGSHTPFRAGKLFVVSDQKGNASSYAIISNLINLNSANDDTMMYIRWYDVTGVQRTQYWTSAGGGGGDLLSIDDDYGSILLVKAPIIWNKGAANGNVDYNDWQGSEMTWFAYFVKN